MLSNYAELAENKLLLLYILNKLDMPISNSHFTQIVLENNLINYFSLQQYLSELVESEFISDIKEDKRHMLKLTQRGKDALMFFISRIPEKRTKIVDAYILSHFSNIKRELEVISEYTPSNDGNFLVTLKLLNNDCTLMELKLHADSNAVARKYCNEWKNNSEELYNKIINMLE